jgi:hypothetical protein
VRDGRIDSHVAEPAVRFLPSIFSKRRATSPDSIVQSHSRHPPAYVCEFAELLSHVTDLCHLATEYPALALFFTYGLLALVKRYSTCSHHAGEH